MMEVQRIRLVLGIGLAFVGFTLWGAWQQAHEGKPQPSKSSESATRVIQERQTQGGADGIPTIPLEKMSPTSVKPEGGVSPERLIHVKTDVLDLYIDLKGGDVIDAKLPKYPQAIDEPEKGYNLLDRKEERNYIAQSGLINPKGPEVRETGARATYETPKAEYRLENQQASLMVPLSWQADGVQIVKTFTFVRGGYLVDVAYHVNNQTDQSWEGRFYGQLRRQFDPKQKKGGILSRQMYQGAAVYTPDKPYKKIAFSKMEEVPFKQRIYGGWVAMLEHYFLSAWVFSPKQEHDYYTRADGQNTYNIGAVSTLVVAPKQMGTVGAKLFLGPELTEDLKAISPGLNLTVDYGILWPISQLIFVVLKHIHSVIGNWGWSIIFVTLFIKLLFYKLSASSYRSMGKMRALQPKLQVIKERCGDDKQKLSQATMELYRKEKINPLGGCLPILVQIPVFIALYYVLLESVELRQAPFVLWIHDLASKDPFYILPLLMGISMFVQQKLNPPPPDPTQAKVMMLMPVIFTVMFLTFPSGLVLYWVANNVLSIIQQWYITKKFA